MKKDERYIIFISDQFSYRCGGSNTVNIELCMAMRQILNSEDKIISLVINCDEKNRVYELEKKGTDLGIGIIHQNIMITDKAITVKECSEICSRIFVNGQKKENSIWIGHDIFTGPYAIQLAKFSGGMSVLCIHTDYDTIEGLKNSGNEGIIKESTQRYIIEEADKVFAIGPRLLERVLEIRKSDVYELIPGNTFFAENPVFNHRAIITYGRFEGNVAQVKQSHLALAAFGRAVAIMNNNKDYVLHIIGTPNTETEQRLRKIAEDYANGRKLSINFFRYTQDRKRLCSCLQNNCAGLMISISEGFGLTGWEMISAGIPLILTKKSGLYDYLEKRFGYMVNGMCLPIDVKGSSTKRLNDDDVEAVARRIVTVFKNTKKMKLVADELREQIRNETWYSCAQNLAANIGLETVSFGSQEIYSDTYKTRRACIEEILNRLEIGEMGNHYLIFFGGISSMLCEERAIEKIGRWLKENSDRRLVLCYETEDAATERAMELDANKIPHDGLPSDPVIRMKAKEKMVQESREKYSREVRRQITLIKLKKNAPLTYVIVVDSNIYFTLRLETRSSEAMTMKVKNSSMDERRKIIESMEYIIGKQEVKENEQELLRILQVYKKDYLEG